ncbi:MAG: hypothetical protein JKP97_20465 [Rhodobacteraceae bacterium]|jgi:glycerol uptake facilitator-like aquaporin|nr:hypothetical protein [Paracoccaceae bacterium]
MRARFSLVVALLLPWIVTAPARACAVCFGDPDSDMAKGAVSGVAFMFVVTGMMLLSIASIAGVWMVRARRAAPSVAEGDAP